MSLKFAGSNRVCGTRKSDNSTYDFFNLYFFEDNRPKAPEGVKGDSYNGFGYGGYIRAYTCTPDVHSFITPDFVGKEVMISCNGNRVFDIVLRK